MASILKVDEMQGVTSAGNITITDGTTTMKMQSGMAKAFAKGSFHDTTIEKSLNVSSATDNGTGDTTYTLTNAMDSADFAVAFGRGRSASGYTNAKTGFMLIRDNVTLPTSTAVRLGGFNSEATAFDFDIMCCTWLGDLA